MENSGLVKMESVGIQFALLPEITINSDKEYDKGQ